MSAINQQVQQTMLDTERTPADLDRWWSSIDQVQQSVTQCVIEPGHLDPLSENDAKIKRWTDLTLAVFGLLLLLPLLLLIALVIKLDTPGPVLFRQTRRGLNGEMFRVFKFRSMSHSVPTEFKQATRHDTRVTTVGRFIRRTSLDELPQLLNVIQGDMSLVGPRPHPLKLDDQFKWVVPELVSRYAVKPGITGWAQINGSRGQTQKRSDMINRIQYDREYISNWSLLLDLRILLETLVKGWVHKNAY